MTGHPDGRSKHRNPYDDSPAFRARWFSPDTVETIAWDLGGTIEAVRKAALRPGRPVKKRVRPTSRSAEVSRNLHLAPSYTKAPAP